MTALESNYLIYVEDDPDDIEIFKEYFGHIDHLSIFVLNNGQQLLDFLGKLKCDHYPCIFVLDINTPILGGWDTVRELKTIQDFRDIPIVMFSTSSFLQEKNSQIFGIDVVTKPTNAKEAYGIAEKLLSYCKS